MSCLPMHLRQTFLSENAHMPSMPWGSCVIAFGIHFENPHVVLCNNGNYDFV